MPTLSPATRPVVLSAEQIRNALETSLTLERFDRGLSQVPNLTLTMETPEGIQTRLQVPGAALSAFATLLREMARGATLAVLAGDMELSTQQAADLLRVSRPYLVKLLEEGEIPFRKVGSHRRVRYEDILAYLRREEEESLAALGETARENQRLGLYP